jgi:fucose permease
MALTGGAMMFALLGDVMGDLKREFILTNEQIGQVVGWSGWGFTLGLFALGPLCDGLGMKRVLWLAVACHAAGIAVLIGATGYWTLLAGAFLHTLGSGAVEAVCNPLIATIYPDAKTHKLNQFHMWFPGGIVIGGVAAYLLTRAGLGWWQLKVGLAIIPCIAYAALLVGQRFPKTERVQAGVSFGGMFRETLLRPLFLVLLVCMMLTASLELGPNRWIPPVLQAGGVPGILVLVWITGLMAVLRYFAGPVAKRLTDTGVLLVSAIVAGAGLVALGYATEIVSIGIAATVFALGVCYFWPTMLGVVAERVPKGGALAMALLGGMGGLFVNTVTIPAMGWIIDADLHSQVTSTVTAPDGTTADRAAETLAALEDVRASYAAWSDSLGDTPRDGVLRREIGAVLAEADAVIAARAAAGALPEPTTANALRVALRNGPPDSAETDGPALARAALAAKQRVAALLEPAENHGGRKAFLAVAPVSIVLIAVFGVMFVQDRRKKK